MEDAVAIGRAKARHSSCECSVDFAAFWAVVGKLGVLISQRQHKSGSERLPNEVVGQSCLATLGSQW
jgi:hypothetical protein